MFDNITVFFLVVVSFVSVRCKCIYYHYLYVKLFLKAKTVTLVAERHFLSNSHLCFLAVELLSVVSERSQLVSLLLDFTHFPNWQTFLLRWRDDFEDGYLEFSMFSTVPFLAVALLYFLCR